VRVVPAVLALDALEKFKGKRKTLQNCQNNCFWSRQFLRIGVTSHLIRKRDDTRPGAISQKCENEAISKSRRETRRQCNFKMCKCSPGSAFCHKNSYEYVDFFLLSLSE
jgi:hypothetical protein